MLEKISFGFVLFVCIFMLGFFAGEFYNHQSYTAAREHTERELGRLREALTDAQVRSDAAIRGLDEAIRGVSAIQDRNQRIAYLIESIGATVKQLRAIYERTGDAVSTTAQEQGPMETGNHR
jgi:predicted extracellular nuclease